MLRLLSCLLGALALVASATAAERTPATVLAERTRIVAQAGKDAAAFCAAHPRRPEPRLVAQALAETRFRRWLAGVSEDVPLGARQSELAMAAAEVCAALGKLSHTPAQPSGWDEARWKEARSGAGQSNLAQGGGLNTATGMWFHDSDAANIDRLGHRRWLLNPTLGEIGFGESGAFAAVHVFTTRKTAPEWDFVAWPPPGPVPTHYLAGAIAWHVTVNPKRYGKLGKDVTLRLHPLDAAGKPGPALAARYERIDTQGFAVANAIIHQPEGLDTKRTHQVVVTGLDAKAGAPAEIRFTVAPFACDPLPGETLPWLERGERPRRRR